MAMIEALRFAFESPWHYAGVTAWLVIAAVAVSRFRPLFGCVAVAKDDSKHTTHETNTEYNAPSASATGDVLQEVR